MRLIDADSLYYKVKCECNPYGKPTIDFESGKKMLDWIEKASTIIDCGEIDHEELGKIPYMDLRPRMTKEKLDEITSRVTDIFSKVEFDDCVWCDRDDPAYCLDCEKNGTVYNLINIIASLHNELYKDVTGKYYDYMFHWANLGYGGSPNDGLFKDAEEVKKDDT